MAQLLQGPQGPDGSFRRAVAVRRVGDEGDLGHVLSAGKVGLTSGDVLIDRADATIDGLVGDTRRGQQVPHAARQTEHQHLAALVLQRRRRLERRPVPPAAVEPPGHPH